MNDRSDILSALEAELDVELIEWEPETQGERVVGTVKSVEYVPMKTGGAMGVVTLATPSGALARVACGAKNLKSQLESAKVQPGDGLALQYEGKRESRNGGNAYNAYRVAHAPVGDRRPAEAFKVPEHVEDDDLLPGAAAASPWGDTTEAPGY